nr:hypothetical protein [Streptomyces caatingaensis]
MGVLLLATAVWAALQGGEPHIGHEEAVYANKARSWLNGTADAGWGVYRPPGLAFLGYLALAVHDDVGALRAVALLLLLFTLTTTYAVAARWTTPARAAVSTLLVLSGLGFLRRAPEFLNDIGSTGLLLVVVHLLVRVLEQPRSRAMWALPVAVLAAFYLRYGVLGSLLAVVVAALLAYGPGAWRAAGRRWAGVAVVLLAGLLPHFLHAARATGSPLGIVTFATSQSNREFLGEGVLYYAATFPYRLAGDLGGVVMAAGIWATVAAGRRAWADRRADGRRTPAGEDRRTVFLGGTALLNFVVLGTTTHGEPRFVYLSVVLLTVLGVQRLATLAGPGRAWLSAAVVLLALLTVLGTAQVIARGAMRGPDRLSDSTVPVARLLSGTRPCLLVTGYEPEMGWYSGCDAVTFAQYRRRKREPPPPTEITFVLFEHGRLQPGADALRTETGRRGTVVRTLPTSGSLGTATLVTLRRSRADQPRVPHR